MQRKGRVRSKVSGTKDRPRVSFYKSNTRLFVQAIDDVTGATVASISTKPAEKTVAASKKAAAAFAKKLAEKKITQVVFDRNGNKYHGAVQTFAEELRTAGITI
jgi:large subunit ribosomal protein L18